MSPRNFIRLSAFIMLTLAATLARADVKVGDAFPSLSSAGLVNLAGGDVPATAGKITLVDFWASWCAPCKASFPAMAKLYSAYSPRGLQIVAVSVDEKPAAATAFWKKLAPPFPAVHDREMKLVQQVSVPTMPTSYLIDRTGRVRFIHAGFHGNLDEVRKEIDALLAEPATANNP